MPTTHYANAEIPAFIVAHHMRPAVTSQTWSLEPTNGRALCHGFLLRDGEATLLLTDDQEIDLSAPALVWIPVGLGKHIRLGAGGDGAAISCSESFVWGAIRDGVAAVNLRSLLAKVAIATAGSFPMEEVSMNFAAIERESRLADAGGMSIIAFATGSVLIHLWRAMGPQQPSRQGAGGSEDLVQRYIQLVELHFRDHVSVQGYAKQLGVTRGRLTAACNKVAGAAPQAILHIRIIKEAQRRLEQTDMSVEQIAYSFGFRDPAYFNRFFSRFVGKTPGGFRQLAKASRQVTVQSFAAWP